MSLSTLRYRNAAKKANAYLDMLASLDKVYADPDCRSLLQELADDDVTGHLSHETFGDNFVHVERVLTYFETYNAPKQLPARKAYKNTRPCGPCIVSKVKVCCSLDRNDSIRLICFQCSPVNELEGRYPCQHCKKHDTLASCKVTTGFYKKYNKN